MITREEVRQHYPNYDHSKAYEKIFLEDSLDTMPGRIRKSIRRPLEAILTVGAPVAVYFLAKEGYTAPNPSPWIYAFATVEGLALGYTVGTVVGTAIYETFCREGELRTFFRKARSYFHRDNNLPGKA
jgi:hypothetical protein